MEEAKIKKEIVVKRLSAFKFEVEVSTQDSQLPPPARVSVIRKAPPVSSPPTAPSAAPTFEPIRHAILQRIVEILLWKLLGERRLRLFCGYPAAPPSVLLQRVVHLSIADARSATSENHDCKQNIHCFLEHVAQFLEICAPTKALWEKFGWSNLSEEAILRKIYEEELHPNLRPADMQQDENMARIFGDLQQLLLWERRGFTAVHWQQNKRVSASEPVSAMIAEKMPRSHIPTKVQTLERHIEGAGWRSRGSFQLKSPESRYTNYPHVLRQGGSIRHHRAFKPPYIHKATINRIGIHYKIHPDRHNDGLFNDAYRSYIDTGQQEY